MSPVAYAREAPSLPSATRGLVRLAAFVAAWFVLLAVVSRT